MKQCIASTILFLAIASTAVADLDILIVGSTHSFSEGNESGVLQEAPFNPTAIASELQSILASDAAISEAINVVFDDIYKNDVRYVQTSKTGFNTWDLRCYSLAQHYMWPDGKTNRLSNLRGENGTAWDYVVIMDDPYVIANFPGMYAEGADMLIDEVRNGTAEPILLAQWPENSSTFTATNFNEVVYRVGESAVARVVPGGKAWGTLSAQDSSSSHPTPDGAYLAAASVYSELFDRNAATSGYTYDDAIANHALSTVQANDGVSQFSGSFTNLTVFTMKYVDKRLVSFNETGTSTENYLNDALMRLDQYCGITFTRTATADPTDWDFNYGRGNDWWEDSKDYSVNPAKFDRSYGFAMHYYGITNAIKHMAYGIDKQFTGSSYNDGTDLGIAYNMIRPGTREDSLPADVRAIPIRLLYTKMLEHSPSMNPLHDSTHMNFNLNDASAAFMYTLLSGRCPLVEEPAVNHSESSAWMRWLGHKIGYETAWRMSHVTTRVPGFQVLPAATNDQLTPSSSETLSVRLWYAPTSDVTVAISSDDIFAGKASPSTLTFTPSNYTNVQVVTVSGHTGSAGSHEFNISFVTSSTDASFDAVQDSWEFTNVRDEGPQPSDIRVFGNDTLVWSGNLDAAPLSGAHLGVVDGPASRIFTITNISDSVSVDLTESPTVTLTGGGGQFVLTQDASGGILAPNGTTPFTISFTPASAGLHTALVSIVSTDWAVPDYRFTIAAIYADSVPTVANQADSSSNPTTATLPAVLTDGGGAQAWICWGETDGGTASTSNWENVISIGAVDEGTTFSTALSNLFHGIEYDRRIYVTNTAGSAWSALDTFSSAAPSLSLNNTTVDAITTTTADLHGTFDGINSIFTLSLYWSTVNNANAAAWLLDGSADSALLGTLTNVSAEALLATASGLSSGTTYYYTWRAYSESTDLWATPNATFNSASAPTAGFSSGAMTLNSSAASLNGVLSAGSGATAWLCWGDHDAGTGDINDWDNVVPIGVVLQDDAFSTTAAGLAPNETYWYRVYVSNAAGTDWSDQPRSFAAKAADIDLSLPVVMGWSYMPWTGDDDSGIHDDHLYTATHSFGNTHGTVTVNSVEFPESFDTTGTNWAITGSVSQWGGDVAAIITGDSEDLADQFIYNGNPRTVTFSGLTSGTVYKATLFSVGWENGTRNLPLSAAGGSATTINQDEYGNDAGISISYTYTATNSSQLFTIDSTGFHLYAMANREVPASLAVLNTAATSITTEAAVLNAALNADNTNYTVYAHWGLTDANSNFLWASSALVGSWTNTQTNISHSVTGLLPGRIYYYTFRATNDLGHSWASPIWQFNTLGAIPAATTNYTIPHTWLVQQDAGWASDYEAAALDDPDGDGLTTAEEYWSGTDPNDSNSVLRIDTITRSGSITTLEWQHSDVSPGLPLLTIQSCNDLQSPNWIATGHTLPVNGTNIFSSPTPQTRFYRLHLVPSS